MAFAFCTFLSESKLFVNDATGNQLFRVLIYSHKDSTPQQAGQTGTGSMEFGCLNSSKLSQYVSGGDNLLRWHVLISVSPFPLPRTAGRGGRPPPRQTPAAERGAACLPVPRAAHRSVTRLQATRGKPSPVVLKLNQG